MTPSEKAIQILEKYANLEYRLCSYDFRLRIERSHKEQAMICLNEILKQKKMNYYKKKMKEKMNENSFKFWLEVQKAIKEY